MAEPVVSPDDLVASVGENVEKHVFTFGTAEDPFILENRQTLSHVEVAYEAYGTLSPSRDNVVLVLHGITGSSHAAGKYAPENRSVGYWDGLIGPGKVFDTDKYFVVAPNSLGGCRGSTGPSSIDPATGRAFGLSFPIVTVRDMVRAPGAVSPRVFWDRAAKGRHRRLDGGDAGARVGSDVPRPR